MECDLFNDSTGSINFDNLIFSFVSLFLILACYILINMLYSKWLKHITILDVNIISIGFVLRILAGTAVSAIIPSIWILLLTYLLTYF